MWCNKFVEHCSSAQLLGSSLSFSCGFIRSLKNPVPEFYLDLTDSNWTKHTNPNLNLPSSCLWTLLSSFKMEVISCNRKQKTEVSRCSMKLLLCCLNQPINMEMNLVGGLQDGDFIFSIDLCLNLLPDLSLVLEQNSERKTLSSQCQHLETTAYSSQRCPLLYWTGPETWTPNKPDSKWREPKKSSSFYICGLKFKSLSHCEGKLAVPPERGCTWTEWFG